MTSARRKTIASALLFGASVLALASPAHAAGTLFASDARLARQAMAGERVNQQAGVTQIRLANGGVASFVAGASFRIREDGGVDLYSGTVTVAGGDGGTTMVHLGDRGHGEVEGSGSAASFTIENDEEGRPRARGHVMTGTVRILILGSAARQFVAGQMWRLGGGDRAELVVAIGVQAVPGRAIARLAAEGEGAAEVADMGPDGAGPLAAAENGLPVVLGDALAAVGASGDIVAAARRVQAAAAAPALETFPSGDLALLVAYAGRIEGAWGGTPFNGAAADIIRTYLQHLAAGGSGAQFITVYAGLLTQYLDLIRAGAAPSSFAGANQAQINSFIAWRGRTGGLAGLASQNRVLVEAYLAFLLGGGNVDQFVARYTSLTNAYFAFLRTGGDPLAFQGASRQTVHAYRVFLRDAGLSARLSAQDRALLDLYLRNLGEGGNGLAFADQYRGALGAWFAFLQQGNLPSEYTGADAATLRAYLEALQSTGLLDSVLGAQAGFFADYLAWLQGGGSADGFSGLPANIYAGYAQALDAYYAYLRQGGVPSAYGPLTQAQISAYLAAIRGAGADARYLGSLAQFWSAFHVYLIGGGNADLYSGLPVPPDYPAFASALNAYAAHLAAGGLPSGYSALTLAQLRIYIDAIIAAGRSSELLGTNASLLTAYFAHLASGGAPDGFSGLPVYAGYAQALNAYYAYLAAGGVPGSYTGLSLAQLQAYLQALVNAGVFNGLFSGDALAFLTGYYNHLSAGGTPEGYGSLPVYATYVNALNAWYAYLAAGGVPSAYTGLSLAQLQAYLQALIDAGVLNGLFSGGQLAFLSNYYAWLAGGGTPDAWTGLPSYAGGGGGGGGNTGASPAVLTSYTGGFNPGANPSFFIYTNGAAGRFTNSLPGIAANGGLGTDNGANTSGATLADVAGDSTGVVGRYHNGPLSVLGLNFQIPENGGFIYTYLLPPSGNLPASGIINYDLYAATRPVYAEGQTAPGTFAANLSLSFGATITYKMTGTITMPDVTYTFASPGAASGQYAGLQSSSITFFGMRPALSGAGRACPSGSGCLLNFYGAFAGSNPQNRLGLTWHSISNNADRLEGAAIFAAQGTYSAQPAATTLTGQAVAYANRTIGTDRYPSVEVTYDGATGAPTAYRQSANENMAIGTASLADTGKVSGVLSWARWTGGTPTGSYYGDTPVAVGANGGYHIIAGSPATDLPASGTVNYALVGATRPTFTDDRAAPGTFSGSVAVVFGASPRIGVDFAVAIDSQTYAVRSAGGVTTPSSSGIAIAADGTFNSAINALTVTSSSNFCAATCNAFIDGFLAGPNASHLGFGYQIRGNQAPQAFIEGVAAFGRQ